MARLENKINKYKTLFFIGIINIIFFSLVLAFTGAPASFPIQKENINLHKYLHWTSEIDNLANKFIKETLPRGSFVGIHLRNGVDWVFNFNLLSILFNLYKAHIYRINFTTA